MRFRYLIIFILVAFLLGIQVMQTKISDFTAKEIAMTKKEIYACERDISLLKQEIDSTINIEDIRTFAKEKKWDLPNLEKEQITLEYNEKTNKYKVQDENPNIIEQVMRNFTE